MPSKKTRINLTIDDDLNALLEDIGRLTKKPKATVVTDFLVDIVPMLTDLRDALELAEQKKDIKPLLAKMTASANVKTAEMNNDMLNQFDWVEMQDD